jgi:hypothetical protein
LWCQHCLSCWEQSASTENQHKNSLISVQLEQKKDF